MKIGYLHISIPQSGESGVTRYGRLIAAEAKRRTELNVNEIDVVLTNNRPQNKTLLSKAAQTLSQADVVHLQYNKYTWGGGRRQFFDLRTFVSQCSSPIVVTVHDIYPDIYPQYGFFTALTREYEKQLRYQPNLFKRTVRTISATLNSYFADQFTLSWLSKQAKRVFISTEEEKQRIAHLIEPQKLSKIPHFVEERPLNISYLEARQALGLDGFKVITIQGFIYTNKGHQLLIEAMPKLPSDIKVIFAGGVALNNENLLQYLLKLAEKKGVVDRLQITGYLPEEDLIRYLIASDLAVCPFKILSASGSLSTWISLGRPILASDLPQIAEYNELEPGAIHTFEPYTADALAEAIQKILPTCSQQEKPAIARLREKLSLPKIFNEHLKHYQDVAKKA